MAKVQSMPYVKVLVEDRPGALLTIAQQLKAKNLGLVAASGRATAPGQGEIYLFPKKAEKVSAALKAAGMNVAGGSCLLIKGSDKTGAMVKSLDALAKAGINIQAVDALAMGGKFASVLWFAPDDLQKAEKALSAK